MSEYLKPVVLENEELSEGVYAASGDCWTVDVTLAQPDAGGYANFRVNAVHSTTAQHISTDTTIVIVFNQPVTNATFEGFDVSISGNTVTLTRTSHGNSYASSDQFNTLLSVWADDYKTLSVVSADISCTKTVNVQGGGANEL